MLTKDDLSQIREIIHEATLGVTHGVTHGVTRSLTREMDLRFAAQEKWIVARFDRLESRFDDLDAEVDLLARSMSRNFAQIDERLGELEG